jgi:hypothetical protein
MKNSLIIIYLIFTGFISFNGYIISGNSSQCNFKYQDFSYSGANYDFVPIVISGKQNHKLNHHNNFESESAYLSDITNINKLTTIQVYKVFSYKHEVINKPCNFYHMDRFLAIFTQTDKTIQSEFLII